jgi:hypothetical protein
MTFKNNVFIVLASLLVVGVGFLALEPVVTTAQAVTDSVDVTQSVTSGIAISSPSNITMTALSTSQHTAVGNADWTVTTNNTAGYNLTVYASASPALTRSGGGGNIADYTPASAETPETWSVPSSSIEFGFSARGTNVNTTTWGTDSDCIAGADVPSAALKWRDFDTSGSADEIATKASVSAFSGDTSSMCVATEQDGAFANSGTYTATITATATAL